MQKRNFHPATLFILCLLICKTNAKADFLSDLANGIFNAKSAGKIVSMEDPKHYAMLKDGHILCCDFQSGEANDTLFSRDKIKKEEQHLLRDDIQGFILLPNERYMLVYTNRKQIYRRSFEAEWFIYNIAKRSIKPLSQHSPQREPVVSADGRYICFAFQNNLYIHKLDFGTDRKSVV